MGTDCVSFLLLVDGDQIYKIPYYVYRRSDDADDNPELIRGMVKKKIHVRIINEKKIETKETKLLFAGKERLSVNGMVTP